MNWINTQIEWLKAFFSEPDGKASMKRLVSLLVVMAYLQSYLRVSLSTNMVLDIPANWMFLIAGIIGLGILDRYVQKK